MCPAPKPADPAMGMELLQLGRGCSAQGLPARRPRVQMLWCASGFDRSLMRMNESPDGRGHGHRCSDGLKPTSVPRVAYSGFSFMPSTKGSPPSRIEVRPYGDSPSRPLEVGLRSVRFALTSCARSGGEFSPWGGQNSSRSGALQLLHGGCARSAAPRSRGSACL